MRAKIRFEKLLREAIKGYYKKQYLIDENRGGTNNGGNIKTV
ncbi:hypothetical protein HNP38_001315 [Chryseobacterium defluvii]|uniref:Uncharacterized protein n=1 Tax=Chryseobacterium defluvii TaxID=160396 RepID=A0A840KES6_9FLAO|nr:hypothetical protein [Chryseobacterium defluvii]MBB4806043.1 hypothetical protein [Chryseobacterium defluvii]